MTIDQKQAVVLSGGGAKGAYEVGVMKALFRGESAATGRKPLNPGIFTGTSVGSYNAAVMVSEPEWEAVAAVEHLENIWEEKIADREGNGENGVFRFRGVPYGLLDPLEWLSDPFKPFARFTEDTWTLAGDYWKRLANLPFASESVPRRLLELVNLSSWISLAPFHRLLRQTLPGKSIIDSPKILRVAATDWKAGRLRVFRNRAGAAEGSHVEMNPDSVCNCIAASSAIPGIFPSVVLEEIPHVDGGVVMNTPLRAAIIAGAETIHVLYLDPELENLPLGKLENTADTMERMFVLMLAVITNRDIAAARRINEMLAKGVEPNSSSSRNLRPLTIHRHRPRADLGGLLGLLDFRLETVDKLIEAGSQAARNHDCADCGCLIPEENGGS